MSTRGVYNLFIVAIFLALSVPSASFAQSNKQQTNEISTKIDAYLRQAAAYGFSGSVLIAIDGKVVLHKGYGLADRSRGIPIAANSVFDIGSVTKQFTAAAIMKLEMQGKLKTEDLISKYLEGVPQDKSEVTIHHVLTHTAGFSNASGEDYEASERDETVKRILQTPVTSKPGTRMSYSNSGYSVLAAIVEKVSGLPYESFLREQLFKPAGMTQTGYVLPKFNKATLPRGYYADKDEGTPLDHLWSPTGPYWNLLGNGGILSTTEDMYKWYKALQDDAILSAEAKKKIFTPFLNNYAYGWDVSKTPHGLLITHNGGSTNGFNSVMGWFAEKNIVGITMSNAGEYYGTDIYSQIVMNKLSRLIFGEEFSAGQTSSYVNLDSSALKKYEGTYSLPSGAKFIVSLRNNQLMIEPIGQEAADILASSAKESLSAQLEATERAQTIVAGIVKKDFEPLKGSLSNEATFNRYRTVLEQRLKNWETNDGAYKDFQILGTVVAWWSSEPAPVTFVKLNFEKRSHLFRLHWSKDGKISGIGGEAIPSPISIPLQPVSENNFLGWHLILAKSVKAEFKSAANKNIELTVTTESKSVKANKTD